MKWIIAFALAVLTAHGQEPPPEDKLPETRRRSGSIADLKKRQGKALEALKKEDPKEYERLMKLKETDRRKFFHEVIKLIKPGNGEDRQRPDGHRHGPRHGGPESKELFLKRFIEHLEKTDPKRAKELQELLRTDPEKGREAIREILRSFKKKHFSGKGDEHVEKILKNYKDADDAKKKELAAELRKMVEESFEKRMQGKQRELDYMKKRIEGLEKALQKYRESKDDLCDKRVADLLRRAEEGPDTEGKGGPGDRRDRDRQRPPRPPRKPDSKL